MHPNGKLQLALNDVVKELQAYGEREFGNKEFIFQFDIGIKFPPSKEAEGNKVRLELDGMLKSSAEAQNTNG